MDTSWKRFEDIFARRIEDVLKTSSKCLGDVLKMSWRRFCKSSWRRFEDILKTLEDVLKTYDQDKYTVLLSKTS